MKTLILAGALAFLGTAGAQAAVIPGLSDVTDNGGGSYTFVFDSVSSDIDGTGMGLGFAGGGISFVASSDQGTVRQDYPSNGGLGVLGRSGSDNLELGLGETLELIFSQTVEVVNWTFNGLLSGNGHQDAADGRFRAETDGGSHSSNASLHDGVGTEYVPGTHASLCDVNSSFCSTSSLMFTAEPGASSDFKGYLESLTIRVATVPVPASLGLMLAGLAGFGAISRKRRRS